MKSTWYCLLVFGLLWFHAAEAQRQITFISKLDKFDLVISGSRGTVAGKKADMNSVKELLPLLSKTLGETCPSLSGSPELTVKDGNRTRMVYVDEGVITDGKMCAMVSGDGLYYFPLHREFLIGDKRDGIKLQSRLQVFRQGNKILDLRRRGEEWESEDPEKMMDWDFIRRFQDSLVRFDIRLRVQSGIAKDKPKLIVQSGGQTFEFYKVTSVMWALKKPGAQWLIASDDWSFWRDFDSSVLEDRYAENAREILATEDPDEKMALLSQVEGVWSQNLRIMYHKLLLDEKESKAIRSLAIKRLKSKPAASTVCVMARIIEESTDDDLRDDAGIVLRLNNPKAPKFKTSDPPETRQTAIDFWRNWCRQKKG